MKGDERYTERYWSKRRRKKPQHAPASACPVCYARGVLVGELGHLLTFECACGRSWPVTRKDAERHAIFVSKLDAGLVSEKREA